MSSYKFLLAPPPRVLVDIETLFDVYTAVLDCHEKEHGTRTPPTWLGSEFPILRNVSPKYGKRITPYFKKPGFFSSLPVIDYALRALFRMETLGFDLYVVISSSATYLPACSEQMDWYMKRFPESWHGRLLVCRDKTLLSADYLIDVQPNPSVETYDAFKKRGGAGMVRPAAIQNPNWRLILLDRPYNQSPPSPIHARFSVWKQWTAAFPNILNLELRQTIPSFAHGSQNSLDQDRLYVFPRALITTTIGEQARAILDDGIIDVNLMDFDEDGYVHENHKGQNDEIHNALHTTYPLHEQIHPLPANFAPVVQRIIALKYYTGMRGMFIRLTEGETRKFFKETLRNHDPHVGPSSFKQMDFENLLPLTGVDHTKYFAFQMGQILGLFEGLDLFTKNDIIRAYPPLEPFIMRKREESIEKACVLNEFKEDIISRTRHIQLEVGPNHVGLLRLSSSFLDSVRTGTASWSPLLEQANGLVIDFKDLTIVSFPPTHHHENEMDLPWPRDPSTSSDETVLPSHYSISVGRESHGHIIYSDRAEFNTPACQKVAAEVRKLDTSSWPWWSRYFFFEIVDEVLLLVASRSRFSHKFLSKKRLEFLRQEMGLASPISSSSASSAPSNIEHLSQ